jgi:hypothetical protein
METRIESDIAYIKAAVSNYSRHDAQFASLEARIERVRGELQEYRTKILDLEMFQSVVKGVLSGIGAMVVIALIVAIFKAAGSGPSNETPPSEEASQHAEATPSGP